MNQIKWDSFRLIVNQKRRNKINSGPTLPVLFCKKMNTNFNKKK